HTPPAVTPPGFGAPPKAFTAVLAVPARGQVVTPDMVMKLDQVTLEELRNARTITVTKDNTTIIDGAGSDDAVAGRVAQIRSEIEHTDSDWDREKLQERLAKLSGGVAVIQV